MSEEADDLFKVLESSDVKVTFSRWCISGLVDDCACWRCLKKRGIEATPESNKLAELRSRAEHYKLRDRNEVYL